MVWLEPPSNHHLLLHTLIFGDFNVYHTETIPKP